MFTRQHTLEEILNTEPIRRACGNLFPSCWLDRVPKEHRTHTMNQIEAEDRMEWGVPFISDAFLTCANLLMETVQDRRFLFVPLWNTDGPSGQDDRIPDADQNNRESVWLFTGNPAISNTAFAQMDAKGSLPPYASCVTQETGTVHPAVIICPGGGYEMLSTYSEGIQLAQRLERDGGYKAFILNYRISPNTYPLPQMDLALAVLHVRAHAQEYHIDPDRILILGASAGGHLCASEAYLHEDLRQYVLNELAKISKNPKEPAEFFQNISARPDGVGLLYPVISFLSEYHMGSYVNLTDDAPGLREQLSAEQHISSDYPPTYSFANADDDCVPASNTTRLKAALDRAGVPHVCEIYPSGGHGVGLGYEHSCREWSEHMLAFFARIFHL